MLKKIKCAVFTIVKNESFFLPIWLKYYRKHFEERDIYILDHQSDDGSVDNLKCELVENDLTQDNGWLISVTVEFLKELLSNYEYVLFTNVDEIVSPDPKKYSGFNDYIDNMSLDYVNCTGWELLHMFKEEGVYDPDKTILSQRGHWYKNPIVYNKPLLTKVPLQWTPGWHNVSGLDSIQKPDPDLLLIHLHRMDFEQCQQRHQKTASAAFYKPDLEEKKWGWHHCVHEDEEFAKWFYCVDAACKLNAMKSLEIFNAMKVNSFDKLYKDAERKCELVPPYLRGVV